MPYCFFKVIRQISRSHGSKNRRIWPKLDVSGLLLQIEFTFDDEMMHIAWWCLGEVPYCFSRSSFQGHNVKKNRRFWPKLGVPYCNSGLNSPMATKCCTKKAWSGMEEVHYCFSRSYVKFQGHTGWKIDDLNPIWVRLLGRSQLSNLSDLPCNLNAC